MKLHIYSYSFSSREEASKYATEMDYDDDNSIPVLWEKIGANWLDEDFLETIQGEDKFDYLETMLVKSGSRKEIEKKCPEEHNTLFLIFALKDTSNENFEPVETKEPLYLGTYDATFN